MVVSLIQSDNIFCTLYQNTNDNTFPVVLIRLVKMVTGKPVNRFPTGKPVTGYQNVSQVIKFITRRVNTTQAMPTVEFAHYLDTLIIIIIIIIIVVVVIITEIFRVA